MDWKSWCGLCGGLDGILKLDETHEKVVIQFVREININELQVCLECMTFINSCIQFSKRANEIQLMFDEIKDCETEEINSIRLRYALPGILIDDDGTEEVIEEEVTATEEVEIIFSDNDVLLNEQESDMRDVHFIEEHLDEDEGDMEMERENDSISLSSYNNTDENEKLYKLKCKTIDDEARKIDTKQIISKHNENSAKFICSICGRSFKDKQVLKNHEKIHLPDEEKLKFPCNFCEKKFINNHCLKVHIARIHEKVFYFFCEICGKGSTTKSDLIWHMDKHTQDRKYPCLICGQKFKSTNSLRNHKRRHEAVEATKQCSICKKEFRSNSALNNHKLVHSNEKRYQCQYCSNSYKRLETYKCHLSSHTGIRPFKCQWCSRTFVNAANCRKHKLKDHPKEVQEYEAIHGKRGVSLAYKIVS